MAASFFLFKFENEFYVKENIKLLEGMLRHDMNKKGRDISGLPSLMKMRHRFTLQSSKFYLNEINIFDI